MPAPGLGWKSQKGRNNVMAYHVLPSKFAGRSALLKRPHILTRPKVLLAANNPRWIIRYAYYAFVFSIPFESAVIGIVPGHLTIARMIGYVFVLVALLQPSLCFRSPPKGFWYFVAYLYVFVALGFVQESEFLRLTFSRLLMLIEMLMLFWLSYNMMRYQHVSNATLMILAVSCTLLAILLALAVGSEPAPPNSRGLADQERISAFGDDPNTTAGVLSLGTLALMGLAYGREKARWSVRMLTWVGLGVLASVIVFTGSRGSLVAVTIGLLALFLSGKGRAPWPRAQLSGVRLKVGLIIVIAMSLLIGISYYYEPAKKRWERTFTEGSMAGRERIFPAALEMVFEKPLIGWGPTHHYYELGSRLGRPFRDTHNLYLWILTETGLVGAIPFFIAVWYCLRGAWKARGGVDGPLPLALLLALLTINLSLTWHNMKLFWIVLAYTLASGDVTAMPAPKLREAANLPR